MSEPTTYPVHGGYHAAGKGWAVFGKTREEALENFRKAEKRRTEILAMPPWYEQKRHADTR